jgi:hypothetical protein
MSFMYFFFFLLSSLLQNRLRLRDFILIKFNFELFDQFKDVLMLDIGLFRCLWCFLNVFKQKNNFL